MAGGRRVMSRSQRGLVGGWRRRVASRCGSGVATGWGRKVVSAWTTRMGHLKLYREIEGGGG